MIRLLICICFICVLAIDSRAQQLKETSYYMQLPNVLQAAKDYHAGIIQAGDNDRTYVIADSMDTENEDTRPFYIYLVSKMLAKGDRELTANLGIICKHFIQNNPDALMGLLFSKGVKPDYRLFWAKAIAAEIKSTCSDGLMACFRLSRTVALERCAEVNNDRLEVIYNMVRAELKVSKR